MSKIIIENASKSFKNAQGKNQSVLENINLEIESGRLVCLVGPSGSGKTTLMNLMAGFETPTSGRVLIDGKAVSSPHSRRIVIFQDYGLFPWLTVKQNVLFGLDAANADKKAAKQTADRYLDMVGLSKTAEQYPHQLSGGMKQRVAIARALAVEPDILFMDEPFGALDVFTRFRLQDELVRLHSSGKHTIIFVTHDLDEAVYLADKVVLMSPNPGRVKREIEIRLPRYCDRANSAFMEYRREVFEEFELVHKESMEYMI